MANFAAPPIPAAPALWRAAKTVPEPTDAPQTVDWTAAAAEPAATPAVVNPAAPRAKGVATTAPTPTTMPNLQLLRHQDDSLSDCLFLSSPSYEIHMKMANYLFEAAELLKSTTTTAAEKRNRTERGSEECGADELS